MVVRGEAGAALAVVLMAMTLLMALGGAVLTVAVTEVRIAAHHRDGVEALYAADALVERIRSELRRAADAQAVLTGDFASSLRDGAPGERRLPGTVINLSDLTNIERCDTVRPCSRAALSAVTAERPWGANNPVWRLYAHGWMSTALGDAGPRSVYLVAWVGDDPYEDDGDPLRDGAGRGHGRLALRVRAYGGRGARRDIDAIVAGVPDNPRLIRWMER
jgi:Tfp pilus assembly protein PilX